MAALALGCSSDIADPNDPRNAPCTAPEIACISLPGGRGAIYECASGELVPATTCPVGTACGPYGHDSFRTCSAADVTVPFGVEGGICNDGTRACAPTDDQFLVCVNGTWENTCPEGYAFPASCSDVYADTTLSYAAQVATLSCAAEGGRCERDGTYECDGQSAFRCDAEAFVHVLDCPPGEECFANPDHAVCGKRFYAVPNVPCFSELSGLVGPATPEARRVCAVDDGAVLACIDDVWVVTEECADGARCGGTHGDVACR